MEDLAAKTVETFAAKRLLTPVRYGENRFFLADYNMNLYRGCNHGCIYCDTRSECYRIDRFEDIRYKENCLTMLETELRQKKKSGVISIGAASDSYNGLEKELGLTRQALQIMKKYNFGVGVTTKGDLVSRDADVLATMGKSAPAYVVFSITTTDDGLCRLLEPGAPTGNQRFAAMGQLAQAGVFTGTWLNPVVPFLTDSMDNVLEIVAKTADNGGRFVMCHFGMTLRTGNREYFYGALDREPRFQGTKQRYVDAYGLSYQCIAPEAEKLYGAFGKACDDRGLLHSFGSINRALREGIPKQLSFC